ncbi:MAG: MraY family glycosyltransferase [Sedimentisphaerales bacterium]|jgi:UDP-GlcNAc:undecaprenyl-phosphate GlcNAc-1-phosphate transferase
MLNDLLGPKRPLFWCVQFWPVLVISFACALAATRLCKSIALRFNIVDKPDNRVKTHKTPVAYLGGIGVLVGFSVGMLCGVYLLRGRQILPDVMRWLFGILAGATISCLVGVLDDIFDISPAKKLFGQVLAATTLLLAGIWPDLSEIVLRFGWQMSDGTEIALGIPIVIFFVLGASNSLNLLDGVDGLCGGVTAIITIGMLLLAIHRSTYAFSEQGDMVRVIVCLALVGGVCGFLPFNRHPAKIFMGDAGSMMLGFVVASLMMLLARVAPRWWIASVIVFGLPIVDTGTAVLRRLLSKKPLFLSDRGHIYDQMIDTGISLNRTVTVCYLLAGLYVLIGLLMCLIPATYSIILFAVVFAISFLVVWKLGFLKVGGLGGARRKSISDAQSGQSEPHTRC